MARTKLGHKASLFVIASLALSSAVSASVRDQRIKELELKRQTLLAQNSDCSTPAGRQNAIREGFIYTQKQFNAQFDQWELRLHYVRDTCEDEPGNTPMYTKESERVLIGWKKTTVEQEAARQLERYYQKWIMPSWTPYYNWTAEERAAATSLFNVLVARGGAVARRTLVLVDALSSAAPRIKNEFSNLKPGVVNWALDPWLQGKRTKRDAATFVIAGVRKAVPSIDSVLSRYQLPAISTSCMRSAETYYRVLDRFAEALTTAVQRKCGKGADSSTELKLIEAELKGLRFK